MVGEEEKMLVWQVAQSATMMLFLGEACSKIRQSGIMLILGSCAVKSNSEHG